jgi:hypothetical protein
MVTLHLAHLSSDVFEVWQIMGPRMLGRLSMDPFTARRDSMGQPLIRIAVVAEADGLHVRLAIAPSILTQVYARDGLGLFDRSTANIAVELGDRRNGRCFERQPVLVEFVPGSEDAEEYASKFRPGTAFELGSC